MVSRLLNGFVGVYVCVCVCVCVCVFTELATRSLYKTRQPVEVTGWWVHY